MNNRKYIELRATDERIEAVYDGKVMSVDEARVCRDTGTIPRDAPVRWTGMHPASTFFALQKAERRLTERQKQ